MRVDIHAALKIESTAQFLLWRQRLLLQEQTTFKLQSECMHPIAVGQGARL